MEGILQNDMKKGIVITTSAHTKDFFFDCLMSCLQDKYPILVVANGGHKIVISKSLGKEWEEKGYKVMCCENERNAFELGGIERGMEHFDEFIHLMDTCVVHDQRMFDMMFEMNCPVHLCRGFFSYLGKYYTAVLKQVGVPKISDKEAAIYWERHWNEMYLRASMYASQFIPELPITTDVFEEKYGRKNMVLTNGFITKYKGTWR